MGLSPEIVTGAERVSAQVWEALTAAARTDVRELNLLGVVGKSGYNTAADLKGLGHQESVTLSGTPMYEIYHPNGKPSGDAMLVLQGASFGAKHFLKPVDMAQETGLNRLADMHGLSIIYPLPVLRPQPSGLLKGIPGLTWNEEGVINMSRPTYPYRDVNRLDWTVNDAVNRFDLNPDTLTGAGMSDGGRILNRYMSDRLGSIKAGVSVSGTVFGDEAKLAPDSFRPAVMIVHGIPGGEAWKQRDLMVPFDGGIGPASGTNWFFNKVWGGMFDPLKDSKPSEQLGYWLRNPDALRSVTEANGVQHTVIDNGGVPLEQYLLKGAQHAWHGPAGRGGMPLIGERNFDFPTSEKALEFLLKNRTNEGGINIARSLTAAA